MNKEIRTTLRMSITTRSLNFQRLDLYIHYSSQALLHVPIFVIAGAVAGLQILDNRSEYEIDWSVVNSECNSLGGVREARQHGRNVRRPCTTTFPRP